MKKRRGEGKLERKRERERERGGGRENGGETEKVSNILERDRARKRE